MSSLHARRVRKERLRYRRAVREAERADNEHNEHAADHWTDVAIQAQARLKEWGVIV